MAALTPPRPLTCRRSAWDGPGANMPGWSRRLRSSAALPWPGSSSGCPRSPGGISGRRGESTERPGGSRRPPPPRPAAGGRSGPPSLLTEGARRTGDLSPFARRGVPRSRPRWLAARAALTAPLRIPGTSGRCRRSPSGSLAPAGAYAEGVGCSAVQAHGCRASGYIFTRRLQPGCSVLPRHGPIRGGCRASRPVRPLSCLDGNGGGDPRGACPGGPGEAGLRYAWKRLMSPGPRHRRGLARMSRH